MTTLDQAEEIMTQEGWLSATPEPFRQTILKRCRLERFPAGATIYALGDPPGGIYGIVSGSIALSIAPGERGPYIAHFARQGFWFGEVSAFTEQPRRIGMTATHDVEVLHLPLPAIRDIVASDPGAWRFFGLIAATYFDALVGAADDLMLRDHVKRFVAVLLRLAGCRYETPAGARTPLVDVTQEDLATMAVISRTTVGPLLRKLEAAGHIESGYRSIRILAPDALREMLAD